MYFTPSAGKAASSFGGGASPVHVGAFSGRKYSLELDCDRVLITDITGGAEGDPALHLVWIAAAENYAFITDGYGASWIYDASTAPAINSPGYSSSNPEEAYFPNAAHAPFYAHGRVGGVVDGNKILIGNGLHTSDLSNSDDLIKFSEQEYWATGTYQAMPTDSLGINAIKPLPILDWHVHDTGDVIIHARNAVAALNINVYPREDWKTTPMMRFIGNHGATGPGAVDCWSNEQIFRSSRGIETLTSQRQEADKIGAAQLVISRPVERWLDADNPDLLHFASVAVFEKQDKVYATVAPVVHGSDWHHRGFLSFNYDYKAWESLNTFPKDYRKIHHFVGYGDRMLAYCSSEQNENRIVEIRPDLKHDILSDGTEQRIHCEIETRAYAAGDPFAETRGTTGSIFLKEIWGEVDWEVRVKPEIGCSILWQKGKVTREDTCGNWLEGEISTPGDKVIPLGGFPELPRGTKYFSIIIKWVGHASPGVSVRVEDDSTDVDRFSLSELDCDIEPVTCCSDKTDYDYSYV